MGNLLVRHRKGLRHVHGTFNPEGDGDLCKNNDEHTPRRAQLLNTHLPPGRGFD